MSKKETKTKSERTDDSKAESRDTDIHIDKPVRKRRRSIRPRKTIVWAGITIAVAAVYLIITAIITNPFGTLSAVESPYRARFVDDTIVVEDRSSEFDICDNWYCRANGFAKSGLYMIGSRYISSPKSERQTVEGIARDIHDLRFDPRNPYIISGDHFTPFYNRSLGIFYYPTLDASIKTSQEDWRDRELAYLQTLGFALGFYSNTEELSTTIVPMRNATFTPINVYSYPSDTLYSLLYGLSVVTGTEKAYSPLESEPVYPLHTREAGKDLLEKYRPSLERHLREYRSKVYDEKTGMIRSDMHLSGTKDITRRQNALYDNVVYWRTLQLADTLGIADIENSFFEAYKQRILKEFWLEDKGYFLEDRSDASIKGAYYSSDWLIVLSTGFLNPANEKEREYYARSIAHITETGVAEPMGLKYQTDRRGERQFAPLRIFGTSSYGGDSIWSFWGLEYMKALLALYTVTGDTSYLAEADRNIEAYKERMVRDRGFPELYDSKGNLYQTLVYRSVRQTGWVIGFEQVLSARSTIDK